MNSIKIQADGITDQQKASPKFQSIHRDVLAQLSVPGFIDVLCAHEAAHLFYFTMAGTKEYEAHPTTIRYDPTIDDYVCNLAAVQMLDIPQWTSGQFWTWFQQIACAHAAGGVVARRLMPLSDGGDEDDRDRFEQLCNHISTQDPTVKIDSAEWWKRAQDTIGEMLKDPKIMAAINQIAAILRPQFGF